MKIESPWSYVYKFTFKGVNGVIEVNNGSCFVIYGNMGAHLDSVVGELREFVLSILRRDSNTVVR